MQNNSIGRDFVVGDIHGCYKALMDALSEVGFNTRQDRLISVGDIIDRGPNSRDCLELLEKPWFYMVLGNHEQMMIAACGSGGSQSWWANYGAWAKWETEETIKDWVDKLKQLPICITLKCQNFSVGICHAEPDGQDWLKMRGNERSKETMLWGRKVLSRKPDFNVKGVDFTVHGHTPLDQPKWVGNRYFIDTGACETGLLTLKNIKEIFEEYILIEKVFR